MLKYEIKKVFSRPGGMIALLLLVIVMGITCWFAMGVSYVNEQGEEETGPAAIARLRAAQKEWAGELDEEKIRRVIEENRRIRESPEAASNDILESNIAYSWGQGLMEIRDLLNYSYAASFREYDYYRADTLSADDAPQFYANRTALLEEWLSGEAKEQFSDEEKAYLIRQYTTLRTPFYYDYMKGWTQLFEFAPTIIMIVVLILGYLVAGIFSNEFAWKADAVFFSSMYGRNKAVRAKIGAGFSIVSAVYWLTVLAYTAVLLFYFGADGWACPVQADFSGWKCFYHITVLEKYVLIVLGGYIGCLFISFLNMVVSARTKSAVFAVMVPVVLIFVPSFLGNIDSPIINKLLGLLPDQLLQTGVALNLFNLYSLGGKILGAVPILLVLYAVLTGILLPVLYQEYRKKQIG